MIDRLKLLHEKYHSFIPATFFLAGFLFDLFTLGRIDDSFGIATQVIYLIIIFSLLIFKIKETKFKFSQYLDTYFDEIFHFLTGSLLSAFTIFYFKSSSLSNSLSFMIIMTALLVLNESQRVQQKYLLKYAISVLCLLSFLTYFIPILIGQVGTFIFLLTLVIFSAIIFIISKIIENNLLERNTMVLISFSIGLGFLILFIFKLIPPVPLSIQHIGIYNKVEKKLNSYQLTFQKSSLKFWKESNDDFIYRPGDVIYIYTRVFSPKGFKDKVYLNWQKKNPNGIWETSDKIRLNISGGRDLGFRGYAYKKNYSDGIWRVLVETSNGSEIGRINFLIQKDESTEERSFVTQ